MPETETFSELDIRTFVNGSGEQSDLRKAFETALSLWGYDYHNPIALLRHNDGVVRRLAHTALIDAAAALGALADRYRAERVPPSSRANPFPTGDMTTAMNRALAPAQRLRNTASLLMGMEAPLTDGFAKRLRDERATLENLITIDIRLVLVAREIRQTATTLHASDLDNPQADLETQLAEFDEIVRRRRDLLAL